MNALKSHRLKIRYSGGTADEGVLDFYEGTTSLQGISQSLSICTHAFLKNKIVSRATALQGARILIRPPSAGSFVADIVVLIESHPVVSTAAATIGAPVFYDFVKMVYRRAIGLLEEPAETPYVQKLLERQEPFFDELAETMEGSLQRAHRPIGDTVSRVDIERPRLGRILQFNGDSKNWVNTREEAPMPEDFTGNVTRFNSITRNGRIYIDQLEKIIPFKPDDDFPISSLGFLTWSLHGSNTELPSKLELTATRTISAAGDTKRILISECSRLERRS